MRLYERILMTDDHSENVVCKRRAAFERVEKQLGTHDTSKLPECYAYTDREAIYEQGLRMGGACLQDMKEHGHDVFAWITPRYNLTNARYASPSE
jgi:acyl-CoA oxidase